MPGHIFVASLTTQTSLFVSTLFQLQHHSLTKMTITWKTIKLKLVPAVCTLICFERSPTCFQGL